MIGRRKQTPEWLLRKERGVGPAVKLAVWIAQHLGRHRTRLILFPVCLYFLIFSAKSRKASRDYLARVLERKPRYADVFRHYHTFASCVLDRVYLLNDQTDLFDLKIHGEEIVTGIMERGEGCLLLGAHLGSFEVLRTVGRRQPNLHVSLVMYEENARKVSTALNAINPHLAMDVIALGKHNSLITVAERLNDGHFVGVLADRSLDKEGEIYCPFLGTPAPFSKDSFRLAAILKRPMVLMFGLYRGGRQYDIYFERLADLSDIPAERRSEMIDAAVQGYVQRLEHYCRLAPYNWFNFYNFWR